MEEITKHLIRHERFDCENEYYELKHTLYNLSEERKCLKDVLTEFFNVYDSLENKSKLKETRNYLLSEWHFYKVQFKIVESSLKSIKKSLKDFDKILN